MPRDLHLATDISALDILAKRNLMAMKNLRLTQACKAAEKLYQCINADVNDEETTYIHISRYLYVLNYIYKIEKDDRFFNLRYGRLRRDLTQRQNELRTNLINRYKAYTDRIEHEKYRHEREIIPKVHEEKKINIFGSDKFITCQQLYEAKDLSHTILIMDVRSRSQFDNSHIKEFNVINIEEKLVTPGLSANKLGEILPNDVVETYNKRSSFDYIILLDFDTAHDNYMSSKLRVLYSILTEWDLNTFYKNSPYVLKGGYIDFIDRYPTYSTNPNVILQHKYEELDELLDLDTIQYPEELTMLKDDTNRMKDEINTLYLQVVEITGKLLDLETQLLEKQKKFYDPANSSVKNRIETDISRINGVKSELNVQKRSLNSKLQSLLEKSPTDNVEKRTEIEKMDYKIMSVSRECRKLIESNKVIVEEPTPSHATTSTITEVVGDTTAAPQQPQEARKPEIPTVNRSIKPKTLQPKLESLGLVGLVNIRNTCYMSSIIQCFRHLPSIKQFFLSGRFQKEITSSNPVLIYETADLVRRLWTSNSKSISPIEFYKKITTLNPVFRRGNHEDANEFFMLVFDHIFADTASPVPQDRYAEAKYQTLYDRIQYKNSFFVKEFYHQIRTDCICGGCSKKCLKYDIENVLMMGVPAKGNCSIEELYDEFMHTCDISDYYCRNCEMKGKIFREFSYQPKIISFLLKRYTYGRGIAEKITVPCDFPTDNFRMGRAVYKLWAVCLHQGSMDSGHYTAVCLNSEDGNWYEFNDECVRPVNINSRSIKEKIYMLFYESEDDSEVGFSER